METVSRKFIVTEKKLQIRAFNNTLVNTPERQLQQDGRISPLGLTDYLLTFLALGLLEAGSLLN